MSGEKKTLGYMDTTKNMEHKEMENQDYNDDYFYDDFETNLMSH